MNTVAHNEWSLPQLTVDQVVAVSEAAYQTARASMLLDLDSAGASPQDRMQALDKLRERKHTPQELLRYAFTIPGGTSIVARSIAQLDKPPSIDALGLEPGEPLTRLALQLLNYDLGELRGSAAKPDPTLSLSLARETG